MITVRFFGSKAILGRFAGDNQDHQRLEQGLIQSAILSLPLTKLGHGSQNRSSLLMV